MQHAHPEEPQSGVSKNKAGGKEKAICKWGVRQYFAFVARTAQVSNLFQAVYQTLFDVKQGQAGGEQSPQGVPVLPQQPSYSVSDGIPAGSIQVISRM